MRDINDFAYFDQIQVKIMYWVFSMFKIYKNRNTPK